jgi:hypothetical protein
LEPLLKLHREASIASPIPTGEPSPDEPAIVPPNEPNAIEPAIETAIKEAIEPAIEDSEKKIPLQNTLIGSPIGIVETVEPDSTIDTEPGEAVTKTIGDKPWYTIDDLLDCHYPSWPKTKEGLRKKALTEQWPKRTRRGSKGNPYEYQAVLPD